MTFGQWLRGLRVQRGLTLRHLARDVSVDIGTLSRIENGQTQPTLATVVRICINLDMSLEQLLVDLLPAFQLPTETRVEVLRDTYVSLDDVLTFLNLYFADATRGAAVLARLLNIVKVRYAITYWADRSVDFPFNETHAELLLGRWPFVEARMAVPSTLTTEVINSIRANGGVLTPRDVGSYLKEELHNVGMTLEGGSAALFKRLETTSLERIKFDDVLQVGHLLAPVAVRNYWSAATTLERITRSATHSSGRSGVTDHAEHALKVAWVFIDICRWLEYLNQGRGWLYRLRETMHST